jgi:formate hydrogenlyase transcriptional activator
MPHHLLSYWQRPFEAQENLRQVLALERDNILATLDAAKWKVRGPNGAAELLGVKPTTLYSRMQKLGIKPPDSQDSVTI